jgi:iron-sulfur cluster assembly protein
MNIPVEISNKAIAEIENIFKNKNIPADYGLRLTVKGGMGCAGVNPSLGFDKKKVDDLEYDIASFKVYIRKGELMYLIGKMVDFYEGSDARGFLFTEPNQEDNSTVAR